jgi:hypothetical protein
VEEPQLICKPVNLPPVNQRLPVIGRDSCFVAKKLKFENMHKNNALFFSLGNTDMYGKVLQHAGKNIELCQ